MKLKCQCCDIEQEFEDHEKAFYAGWDAPPHFRTHICCNICPAVSTIGLDTHHKAHAYWKEHGRPESFNNLCVTDKDWGKTQEKLEADMKSVSDAIFGALAKTEKKH